MSSNLCDLTPEQSLAIEADKLDCLYAHWLRTKVKSQQEIRKLVAALPDDLKQLVRDRLNGRM